MTKRFAVPTDLPQKSVADAGTKTRKGLMEMDERGEAVTRQDVIMWAWVTELEALKTTRTAMEAHGRYTEEAFLELAKQMNDIAEKLDDLAEWLRKEI